MGVELVLQGSYDGNDCYNQKNNIGKRTQGPSESFYIILKSLSTDYKDGEYYIISKKNLLLSCSIELPKSELLIDDILCRLEDYTWFKIEFQ